MEKMKFTKNNPISDGFKLLVVIYHLGQTSVAKEKLFQELSDIIPIDRLEELYKQALDWGWVKLKYGGEGGEKKLLSLDIGIIDKVKELHRIYWEHERPFIGFSFPEGQKPLIDVRKCLDEEGELDYVKLAKEVNALGAILDKQMKSSGS